MDTVGPGLQTTGMLQVKKQNSNSKSDNKSDTRYPLTVQTYSMQRLQNADLQTFLTLHYFLTALKQNRKVWSILHS